jgi:transcriptional regulator with XRE-family HTH domain
MPSSKRYKEDFKKRATFWEAIRAIRQDKKMTQSMVAEGVRESADAPWISRVEAGQKDISLRTAIRIAEALGEHLEIGQYLITNDD